MNFFVTLSLLFIALVSPALTMVRLLQQKEWRRDRLHEHLKKEGWFIQLFGLFRPITAAIWLTITIGMMFFVKNSTLFTQQGTIGFLLTLCVLGVIQIGAKRQRMPVWTSKAIIVTTLTLVLPLLVAASVLARQTITTPLLIGLIVSLPALWSLAAWILFMPIDTTMKKLILARAENIRKAHPNLTVIGITGSVGKTTMKELLSHLLNDKNAIATPLHVNTEMGVAAWLTRILQDEPTDSRKILIIEMGAYRTGEIATLCRISQPTIGVITAIGMQHLSLFGSKENIIQGKGELFEALPSNGLAVGNSDNESFDVLKKRATCRVIGIGTDHHADIQAFDIEETSEGIRFRVFDTSFHSSLAGTHSVIGLAMAVTIAKHLGVEPKTSAKILPSFQRMQSTFEVKNINGVSVLDDTYNSSPESVEAAIEWAARRPEQEKYLLLEGIIELGQAEEEIHRILAEKASKIFNTVFVAHSRLLPYFQEALEKRVQEASHAGPMKAGCLLVICGRVRPSLMKQFLPQS